MSKSRERNWKSAPPWLRCELAFVRVLVSGRDVRSVLRKYSPDQPRVPGGQPGGGRWTSGDGASPAAEAAPASDMLPSSDTFGNEPWAGIATTSASDGQPAAQVIGNSNGGVTTTEWDTAGVEPWAARQSQMDESGRTVLTTEFGRDGTARFAFGAGAAGMFELTNASGELGLGLAAEHPVDGTGLKPGPGDRLALLTPGIAIATDAAAGAAGAASAIIVAGSTAFPSPTGSDTVDNLGPDLRIVQSDSGRPPSVEYRDGDGWRPVDGAVSYGKDATTYVIDAGRLRSALGDEKVDQAVSALQERARDTIVGERWTPDTGATRDFKQGDVEQTCRMYPSYKAAVEWAASSVNREGLSPSQYGTAVHTAVDHYFKYNYPAFDPGTGAFNTEFSLRKDTRSAYYSDENAQYGTKGSLRFDAYEDTGDGAVCAYDIKTGARDLGGARTRQLRDAATSFYQKNNNGTLPREVVIMQVKPWR